MVDAGGGVMLAQVLWQSPALLPAAVAMLGIVLAAVLWLYPPQMRIVPRPWRWLPPMLRAMAVTALTVSLVQPAVLRPRGATEQGAVLVLVDRSHSMSVIDRGRSPAELVALAAGLGALPKEARQEAAPQLRAQLESIRALLEEIVRLRSEAEYARISGRPSAAINERLRDRTAALMATLRTLPLPTTTPPPPPELLGLIAQLQQPPAAMDDAAAQVTRGRVDAATRTLSVLQAQLDQTLHEQNGYVRAVCTTLERSSRLSLVERALLDPSSGVLSKLGAAGPINGFVFAESIESAPSVSPGREQLGASADGAASDVTGAVINAIRRMRTRAVQAVVVLSDGRQVGGEQSPDLSAAAAPVFTVSAAAPLRRDIALTAMEVPPSARIDEPTPVRVELHGVGVRGQTVELRLDAGDVREIRRVQFGEESPVSAEFSITLRDAGTTELTATVLALADEVSGENNRMRRWVKVAAEPLRVTVIAAADAGKQYASLHEVLSRAPWVTLREVEEGETFRLTPAAILAQDIVVLCDLPPDALSRAQWDALDQLVRQRGGSVVITAGAHTPAAYAQHPAADWLPQEPQERMAWRTWPGGEPHFRVAAAATGASDSQQNWRNLPPVSGVVAVTRPRPGVQALLLERESGQAIVTESTRGIGKVFFIGTDESWRWRARADAGDVHQFWPSLLRRAAPEPYAAVEGNLSLDAAAVEIEPGEPVELRALIYTDDGIPSDQPTHVVEVLQGDEVVNSVTLAASEGTGRYRGVLPGLSEGEYTLRLDPPDDPSLEFVPEPATLPLHVRPNVEAEMTDLSGDERTLRRMAESSGGAMVSLEQVSTLPALLAANRAKQSHLVEYRLWDSPYLFVFVLACLSAEWALRKKFGLA